MKFDRPEDEDFYFETFGEFIEKFPEGTEQRYLLEDIEQTVSRLNDLIDQSHVFGIDIGIGTVRHFSVGSRAPYTRVKVSARHHKD